MGGNSSLFLKLPDERELAVSGPGLLFLNVIAWELAVISLANCCIFHFDEFWTHDEETWTAALFTV